MSQRADESDRLRVLVCDDHALFRRGLQMVLDQEADLELVGEASDGVEVVEKAQELMPDVILMDVRMPKRSGIEAAAAIKDVLPHVKILMLTISDAEADLYEAIKAGASGYLLKEIPIEEVADAIRSGGLANTKGPRIQAILREIREREGRFDLSRLRQLGDEEATAYLASLPGVGPKTAAVVLAFSLDRNTLPVDTHVHRVTTRLGWVEPDLSPFPWTGEVRPPASPAVTSPTRLS